MPKMGLNPPYCFLIENRQPEFLAKRVAKPPLLVYKLGASPQPVESLKVVRLEC